MSKRLQVVLDDAELLLLRRRARRDGLTLSEWVRRVLARAARTSGRATPEQRLAALDRALGCGFPSSDLDEMLAEMERGRGLR